MIFIVYYNYIIYHNCIVKTVCTAYWKITCCKYLFMRNSPVGKYLIKFKVQSYFNFVYFFVRNLYKRAASRHFVNLFLLLYSRVGEYKGCHIILDQSQRRISYVHLCKNTNTIYFHFHLYYCHVHHYFTTEFLIK